ncbi:hypothetical protein V2A60_010331 [Cordyceps javanica]
MPAAGSVEEPLLAANAPTNKLADDAGTDNINTKLISSAGASACERRGKESLTEADSGGRSNEARSKIAEVLGSVAELSTSPNSDAKDSQWYRISRGLAM